VSPVGGTATRSHSGAESRWATGSTTGPSSRRSVRSPARAVHKPRRPPRLLSARGLLLRLRLARAAGLADRGVVLRPLCHDVPPCLVGSPSLWRPSRLCRSLVPSGAICSQAEISEASLPNNRAVASEPGHGDRERLPQTGQTGEGRASMPSRQPQPPHRRITAIPADDLPRDDIGDGRPSDAQLIVRRAGKPQSIRARPRPPSRSGIVCVPLPLAAGRRLTVRAHASDPTAEASPRAVRQEVLMRVRKAGET
jgi:hypothetical protein